MSTFHSDMLTYIKDEDDIEKIIALTLRDIFLNELIYIRYTNEWKQYDLNKKTWSDFDVNTFMKKMDFIKSFYENDLIKYIKLNVSDEIERFYLIKEVKHLTNYITKYMIEKTFIEHCKLFFKIGV